MSHLKRALATCACAALGLLALAPAASAEFGLTGLATEFLAEGGAPTIEAGTHPYSFTTQIEVNTKGAPGSELPDGEAKDLRINFPPGLVGTPNPVPPCPSASFAKVDSNNPFSVCPASSQVGVVSITVGFGPKLPGEPPELVPVFNLEPGPGQASKIGFIVKSAPVTIETGVNPNPPYNLLTHVTNIPNFVQFYASRLTLWGVPASAAHDAERFNCPDGGVGCSLALPEIPFLTLPTSCEGPLETTFEAAPWSAPGTYTPPITVQSTDGLSPPSPIEPTGCERLKLSPTVTAAPTTPGAESPSGLDFAIAIDDPGLTDPKGTSQSTIKKAIVTLPEGVTANPSLASGLLTCSEAALDRETADSVPGAGCPQASKIGTVEVETPLLPGELLHGQVFIATQGQNPFGSLLALYMVIKDPGLGILVKLPGRVSPDPVTGQLITTFGEPGYEIPQFPFSKFRFHFREGGRSPLVTPPSCGTYQVRTEFIPWSGNAPVIATAPFQVNTGPNGAPCPPGGIPPFNPTFSAGSLSNDASSYSPFLMRLTRNDGDQDMTRFDAVLPPGVVGKIAGLTPCPQAAVLAAKSRSGRAELAAPSCPADSLIGRTMSGAGVGPELTWVPGSLHLGGPVGEAPLSVVAIVPAVAGPFDVGTVVVQEALRLNETTAQVEVDGSLSDPIPHILQGIPLKLRDLRINVDRPTFTLNATSCDPMATRASLFGSFANPLSPADDIPVALAARYQAASCASLGFGPKLSLRLLGATKRGQHPALKSAVTYPYKSGPGYSNIGRAVVVLPPSQQIDNAHVNNPCTRAQFAERACPKNSILGTARATTPLLDAPLEGPVYFRSNGGVRPVPDIVADLRGQFHIVLVGAVDTLTPNTNPRIRTTFAQVPDAPVTKFTLDLYGGKRGLLVNNRNVCKGKQRAKLTLTAHNGAKQMTQPLVKTSCGGKGKSSKSKRSSR